METRTEKINRTIKEMLGNFQPYILWEEHKAMPFWYDEKTDSLVCDCEIIKLYKKIELTDDEINEDSLFNILDCFHWEIYYFFLENYKINLGLHN